MLRLLGCILLALPCVHTAELADAPSGNGQRIDLRADGQRASTLLAALSELSGRGFAFDHALLEGELPSRRLVLQLRAATPEQAAQAVAHALRCRWTAAADGRILFSRGDDLPGRGDLHVRSYTFAHPHADRMHALVRRCMAPWLHGDAGLVYHPPMRRWIATLDDSGHRRLAELLSAIERPEPRIPPVLAEPTSDAELPRATVCADWPSLIDTLSRDLELSVSIDAETTAQTLAAPIALPAGARKVQRAALREQGIVAEQIDGVLCCGGTPAPTQHPAQRSRLVLLPVAHLGDRLAVEACLARMRRDCAPGWWEQSGAAYQLLPDAGLLLMHADHRAQRAVLRRVAELEEHPPAYGGG